MLRLFTRHALEQRLVGPGQPDRILFEEDHSLQIDLANTDLRRHAHERRQFGNGLLQTGEPGRDARALLPFALLQVAKRANVSEDAAEVILAADRQKGLGIRRVERDAKLVQTRRDQRPAVLLVEQRAVGVEQDVSAALLEISHHLREVLHQHRLADAVQHRALQLGNLVDDRREQRPAHIGRRLERFIGARACRAQQIAAICRLQIDADR